MTKKLGSQVLVTGVAGFIGSHLAERLRSMGLGVTGIDNFSNGYEENLTALKEDMDFKLIRGDILNPNDLSKACEGVDSIFHMAAQSSVARSTEDPIHDFELNTIGMLNVLECARKADIETILFASSSTVYGEAPVPTPEEHPLRPISNYGASKAAAEAYCHSYSSLYGLRTASLRYYNIYGPRSRKGVMFDLLQKLRKDCHRLEVLGTGEQKKDYLYVEDVIDATLLVSSSGKLKGEAYNIGSGESHTVKELVDHILRNLGLNSTKVIFRGGVSWAGDVQNTLPDTTKIRKLGFAPKTGFKEGTSIFVKWYQSEYGKISGR
ncbi:MAG: UDP-glucose 4-epimerase [Hadesarchaea archaeon]|nr:MAG: UDP-glucose 4-epimerase [Hadesarchaea archaeon]HDI12794.1 NAD-dependent epimerase/dehydratase family protein [Hadesarchaea archaeon]